MDDIILRDVTDFMDHEYKSYSMNVIEDRAIPSVIDGFKPTARKVIAACNDIWKSGSEAAKKVFQVTGIVADKMYYHHGDSSLNACITGMAQGFKNSLPLLSQEGQFGSLRCPVAGAPRYIGVSLSPYFRMLYKDFDLLEPRIDEGVQIEPAFFLPIVPTVILNGSSGIAIGYATNILNRNPQDVIDACINVLNGKKIRDPKPWLSEFHGTWEQDPENHHKWITRGVYDINKNCVHITELPPNWTFEKYEEYLESLLDKKIIQDYENYSAESVDYVLKFKNDVLEDLIINDKLDSVLKITGSETEQLNTLDENGKLKIFETVTDIIKYFVDYRLKWYEIRKNKMIDKLEYDIKVLSNRASFIKAIIDKKIKVNNVPKDEIIEDIEKLRLERIDGSYDYLLNMPIYTLTKEKYESLCKQLDDKKKELKVTNELVTKEMYIDDLKELKKKIK